MNQTGRLWENLPELVLTKIYKLLNPNDRLAASATCKPWRNILFQSCFWTTLKYDDAHENQNKKDFIIEKSAHLYDRIEIFFNPGCNVAQTRKLFKRLTHSKCLHILILRTHSYYHHLTKGPGTEDLHIAETLVTQILDIVQNAPIQILDFGCYEYLALYSAKVLSHIDRPELITKIGFATIKRNPSNYPVGEPYQIQHLNSLTNLQMISLDYDLLNESVLLSMHHLKRLIIHIHGVDSNHRGISEQCWESFKMRNPYAQVRMTLISAFEAVEILHTDILRPSIPLTHFRAFFCHKINRMSLDLISVHYKDTLRTLVWVDDPMDTNTEDMEVDGIDMDLDPFVMMSWMVKKLQEVVVLGHNIEIDSIIAMARLRGPSLKRLQVDIDLHNNPHRHHIVKEIESALERPWTSNGNLLYRTMCNTHSILHKMYYRNKFMHSYIQNDLVIAKRKAGK